MRVLFFSPGFPKEMPDFARGLAEQGAEVIGLGDQPAQMLPEIARRALADYIRVDRLFDEDAVLAQVRAWARRRPLDQIECLWEPGMLLAARLREALGLPGMTVADTVPFRDKETMKQRLDDAGIRTPRHRRAASADEVREATEAIGYPLIVKPIAGAGSADTYRLDGDEALEEILPRIRHVAEVSVEEYVEGEEFTFDTVCADGEILFENIAWYRPKPLIARTQEWISPQTVNLRDIDQPHLQAGREMGQQVIDALGFQHGFTHMEWFLTADGEAVFGEIGARPPGARSVDLMNYTSDIDIYNGWAEAVLYGRISQQVERQYNAVVIFKRAQGEGRIQRIEGLTRLLVELGPQITVVDLLPVGASRRDWKATLISDGYLIVRHPNLETAMALADRVGEELKLYAG